ncbi:hypothetical protein MMC18_003597 [Xylographa bjoerkii]|nr:hypothetical protein [Xylographa bjoerkii]
MASNNLNSLPLEIKLQILGYLLVTDPDGDAYYVDPMREDEERCKEQVKPKWDIQPAILRTSMTWYLEGVEVLYGCNAFKFRTAKTMDKFIVHINQSRLGSLSHLIRRVLLIVILNTALEAEEWISCLTGGLFQKHLPNLKRATVFLSHTYRDNDFEVPKNGRTFSREAFDGLGATFKKNLKADSMHFYGFPGRKDPSPA